MSCSCVIDVSHDGSSEDIASSETPVARKEHKCCECHRVIQKGEKYERYASLCEGSWDTYKTCWDCFSVRNALFCNWYFGRVWEEIWENFAYNSELPSADCMMQMTKAGRDRYCDMLQEYWGDDWDDDDEEAQTTIPA
jgi:hypothetical protein